MSPARVHGSRHVEGLPLPKSFESSNLSLAEAVIGWISAKLE
jgi:hypothetical protein